MNTVIDDGVELVVWWDGAHNGRNEDLFRRVVVEDEPRGSKPFSRPFTLNGRDRDALAPGRVQSVPRVIEVRECPWCSGPVNITTHLRKSARASKRCCSQKCNQAFIQFNKRKAAQVAA